MGSPLAEHVSAGPAVSFSSCLVTGLRKQGWRKPSQGTQSAKKGRNRKIPALLKEGK